MSNEILKVYGCKDEELIFICGFTASSVERDLADFTAYSPKLNQGYLIFFKGNIATATDVIMPRSLVLEQKTITARLYATMDGLIEPMRHLTGYINLSKSAVTISVADFGFTPLRAAINSRDAEGAFKSLQAINANVAKFKAVLIEQGLTEEFAAALIAAAASITEDKQKQYEIDAKRRNLLQANIGLFNDLYAQLTEILSVGKILYKGKDPVKLKEYTFTELMKKVNRSSKPATEPTSTSTDTTK
jgi:hypothetical protein